MPPRLGSVAFLNAMPLVEGLASDLDGALTFATPARIADDLASGALDIGLVPVAEAARQDLWMLPGPAVVARAAVRSVLLVSRVPPAKIARLALDPASRTSVVLARLLLAGVHGVRPEAVLAPASGHPLEADADAAVVIGDRALTLDLAGLRGIDLGQWWIEWTGRPFVFAAWAGPDPELLRKVEPALLRARARGRLALAAIAEREGPPRGIATETAAAYLREAIHFDLAESERNGLEQFLELARGERLLPPSARVRFLERA